MLTYKGLGTLSFEQLERFEYEEIDRMMTIVNNFRQIEAGKEVDWSELDPVKEDVDEN